MNHTTHYLSKTTLALIGAGTVAAGSLGYYLYRSPKLRRQMRRAASVKEAASLLTHQIQEDSVDVANNAVASVSETVADNLIKAKRGLGLRFWRKERTLKDEAKHLKNEARNAKENAKAAARFAGSVAKNEAEHMANEMREAGTRVMH